MTERFHHRVFSCLLVLAALLLAGCGTSDHQGRGLPPISAASPLTVMSFDIRLGLGRGDRYKDIMRMSDQWGRNLSAVIDAIRSADPDIVGLQEVAGPDQLREIADELNMNQAYVAHDENANRGVGILSKYPIVSSSGAALSGNRNFIMATIDVGPKKILVANIIRWHLEFTEESMPFLMAELAKSKLPTVLVGDFNMTPDAQMLHKPGTKRLHSVLERFVDTAVEAGSKSAETARQVGTWHGGGRVDYVFAEKGRFGVVDAGIVAQQYRNASDHIACFAKLKFQE